LWKIKRLSEWKHHGYYGIVIIALSIPHRNPWLLSLGYILLIDDTLQHFEQALGVRARMDDFTPIHKFGAWLMGLDYKKLGWFAPAAIVVILTAAAIFFALREFRT
jgi:hypothetical protein